MDPIQPEETKGVEEGTSQEKEMVQSSKISLAFERIGKSVVNGLRELSLLEKIGLLAMFILVMNLLFDISVTVTRKPFLQKILGGQISSVLPPQLASGTPSTTTDPNLLKAVIPTEGVELPITWGDLGKQMITSGVIDQKKFDALYKDRGGLTPDMQKLLSETGNGKIRITSENSGTLLNLLWALGLGNKNDILEKGEMQKKEYGGAGKFASTGGWTLATGQAMDHYSKHQFIRLTAEQQTLVEKVSKGVFRPCCNNSTHFPDCNHGMAMLGLLELMASQGVTESDMYKAALAVNSYWFPDTYLTIASYFKKQGTDWKDVNPQTVLSAQYSSSRGYQQLLSQVTPQTSPQGKGGCGV